MPEPNEDADPTPAPDRDDHGGKLAEFLREIEDDRDRERRGADLNGGSGEHRELD